MLWPPSLILMAAESWGEINKERGGGRGVKITQVVLNHATIPPSNGLRGEERCVTSLRTAAKETIS